MQGVLGGAVSEAGRQRTIDLFGEALSPREVVQRICEDVRSRGIDALLYYTAKLDRKELSPTTIQVTPEELAQAARQADPRFIDTVRHIRDNVTEFQQALLPKDARVVRKTGQGSVAPRPGWRPASGAGRVG